MFTVLFEYCRVSDTALECILERFVSNKLPSEPEDIRIRVVTSLVQVWKIFFLAVPVSSEFGRRGGGLARQLLRWLAGHGFSRGG